MALAGCALAADFLKNQRPTPAPAAPRCWGAQRPGDWRAAAAGGPGPAPLRVHTAHPPGWGGPRPPCARAAGACGR